MEGDWKKAKSTGAAQFKNGAFLDSQRSFEGSLASLRTQIGADSKRHGRDIAVVSRIKGGGGG